MVKKPKILLVTPGLEPGIDLPALPIPSLIIPCSWKDRGEHYLCSQSFNQSAQGPEVSFHCPWTTCLIPEKSITDNNPRAVPGQVVVSSCL